MDNLIRNTERWLSLAEGARLEIEWTAKTVPRVRIPPSPPLIKEYQGVSDLVLKPLFKYFTNDIPGVAEIGENRRK